MSVLGLSIVDGLAILKKYPDDVPYFINSMRELHDRKKASEELAMIDLLGQVENSKHVKTHPLYVGWMNERRALLNGTLKKKAKKPKGKTLFEMNKEK